MVKTFFGQLVLVQALDFCDTSSWSLSLLFIRHIRMMSSLVIQYNNDAYDLFGTMPSVQPKRLPPFDPRFTPSFFVMKL
jgi:hypothetical protein